MQFDLIDFMLIANYHQHNIKEAIDIYLRFLIMWQMKHNLKFQIDLCMLMSRFCSHITHLQFQPPKN